MPKAVKPSNVERGHQARRAAAGVVEGAPLAVRPLTPERWPDLEALFAAKGCSMARSCWCMYYRHSGAPPKAEPGQTPSERNRRALKALARRDPPPGLVGYEGATPVGWVSLGPRAEFLKLRNSPVMKAVDDQDVWSIVCFVVPPPYGGRGVAKALLAGAVEYAAARGVRLLEAYPVDTSVPDCGHSLWFGSLSMYEEAGFREVARRKPARPVVRLVVPRAAP
jgi:ribosomal protein S18 acetylase RimI-like enzyme